MAKTVKIIFVKANGIGMLLEGEALATYQKLHKQALTAYKKEKGMLDTIKGKAVQVEIEEAGDVEPEEFQQPVEKIIMVKEDGSALLLRDQAYSLYRDAHFTGMKIIGGNQENIKGKHVRITFV